MSSYSFFQMDQFLQSMATTSATFVGKAAYSYAASLALKKIQSYSFQGEKGTNLNNNKDTSSLQDIIGDKEVLLKNYKVKLSRKLSVLLQTCTLKELISFPQVLMEVLIGEGKIFVRLK